MKVVIAPDSFKGSVSAKEVCAAIRKGVERVFPDSEVIELPLADGGEGTMENMVYSSNGTVNNIEVFDPLGRKIYAGYGVLGDDETAVVEMAQASGLPLLHNEERDPLHTTSYGTGELIKHALDSGYRKFIIGLGGSATNDGGMGMLKALGFEFFNSQKEALPEGGKALKDLAIVDESNMDKRIHEASFIIASDVTNPLCGDQGASAIFGPQKGATPAMVKELDEALDHFAEVVYKQKNGDMRLMEGGGAAGGMGAALLTFLGAEFRSGIQVVMESIQFEKLIEEVDLVITGEGRLDHQTLSGKVIAGVSKSAEKLKVPVIGLCGGMMIDTEIMDKLNLVSAFSIAPGPCSLEEAMENAEEWIIQRTETFMRVIKHYQFQQQYTKEAAT
ncbi:glycerate kinase [Bacillus sp. Marseille-Q3570]|uniref:glycerate kinase n=1 Tax=Bacillus sp. Marseille-Q3570 TaxID=2963522 RepID=UPI0021B7B8B6|nr:glycerate kinase [Bacillus sp. Marseille-Q3570]